MIRKLTLYKVDASRGRLKIEEVLKEMGEAFGLR